MKVKWGAGYEIEGGESVANSITLVLSNGVEIYLREERLMPGTLDVNVACTVPVKILLQAANHFMVDTKG
jgi:hypothetical protein